MPRSTKTNPSPLRKQGNKQNRDRKRAAPSPKSRRYTRATIQPVEVALLPQDPKTAEQVFRERQAATSVISKHIIEEMQKNDPRSLNRRSCWLVINELYNRLCCCKLETPIDEIQKINRILIEQGKLQIFERKSRSKTAKKLTTRSGPLPDTLATAIQELYGGNFNVGDSQVPQVPCSIDNPNACVTESAGSNGAAVATNMISRDQDNNDQPPPP